MKKLLFGFLLLSFLSSCDDDIYSAQLQLEEDIVLIEQYMAENNINAIEDGSGVFYVVEEEGTGSEYPSASAQLSMAYRGYLMDGTEFDSATTVNPLSINLAQTITGWRFGIPKFKKGGKGLLIIPSPLAYGNSPAGNDIPANSILIFEVEILDFTN